MQRKHRVRKQVDRERVEALSEQWRRETKEPPRALQATATGLVQSRSVLTAGAICGG